MSELFSDSLASYAVLLFAECAKIVLLTSLAAALIRSVSWRRVLWRSCVIGLALLVALETTGVGRSIAASIYGEGTSWSPGVWALEQLNAPSSELSAAGNTIEAQAVESTFWGISVLWAVGAIIALLRLVAPRFWVERLLSRSQYVTNRSLLDTLERLRRELRIGRPVLLLRATGSVGPLTIGAWRPVILLPEDFERCFTQRQQEAILAHELGHVQSRDAHWGFLFDMVTAALWWHPFIWYAKARNAQTAEFYADQKAPECGASAEELATSLVRLGRGRLGSEVRRDHEAAGWNALPKLASSQIRRRVGFLLNPPNEPSAPSQTLAIVSQCALGCLFAAVGILCLA